MFNTGTPDNIDKMTVEEILGLINDKDTSKIIPKEKRLVLIKMICNILGYTLSPDLALALLSEVHAQLVLATAGSGKTTFVYLKIILEKIMRTSHIHGNKIRGNKILYLIYNNRNVKAAKFKHAQLVSKLYSSGVQGLNIDNELNACTMHSFCETWKNEYVAKCGLVNFKLATESQCLSIMKSSVSAVLKKNNMSPIMKVSLKNLLGLYNLVKESLLDMDSIDKVDKFIDLNLPKDFIRDVFQVYDKLKNVKRLYDYTDMLSKVLELLKVDESVRHKIHSYYDYIAVDETQDFTPIMTEILKLVTGPQTPLVCIGDEDQSIYNFRGADIFNTLNFKSIFEDSEIYILSKNRRCRKKILDVALKVITENTLRFNKRIVGEKEDGVVEFIPYSTKEGQYINIVNRIEKISRDEYDDTVICYRDRESSMYVAELLEEHKIPFNIISGHAPFTHELYRHVFDVLDCLEMPYDQEMHLHLYKVLPLKKQDLFAILDYDESAHQFKGDSKKIHFVQNDYGKFLANRSFVDPLSILGKLSTAIKTEPLSAYFPIVFELLKRYYWNYKSNNVNDNPIVDAFFTDRVYKFFNVNMKYSELYKEYTRRKEVVEMYDRGMSGVTLSTFHGLKGLEYKNVFIIDMDESFPNFSLIDSKAYPSEVKLGLKECETRLCYVAITRAKDNCYIYYSDSNPSYYIKRIFSKSTEKPVENKELTNQSIIVEDLVATTKIEPVKYLPTEEIELELTLEMDVFEPMKVEEASVKPSNETVSSIKAPDNLFKSNSFINSVFDRV